MNICKIVIFIPLFFCSLTIMAEKELCVINDLDGFTNVRSGKGVGFAVVDKLTQEDFFYADLGESQEWIKVIAVKWSDGSEIEGYVHRSRIQPVRTLSAEQQGKLLKDILTEQLILTQAFIKDDSYRSELERYDDYRYSPVLEILPQYICKTKDAAILQLFYSVLWADSGSANEVPSYIIGECFICNSEFVIKQLELLSNIERQNLVFEHIEWGLLNSENKDVEIFKVLLNKEKNRVLKLTP